MRKKEKEEKKLVLHTDSCSMSTAFRLTSTLTSRRIKTAQASEHRT